MWKMALMLSLAFAPLLPLQAVHATHKVGIVAGPNLSDLEAKFESGYKLNFSKETLLGAGLFVEIGLTERLSLVLQPMYLQKGGEYEYRYFSLPIPLGKSTRYRFVPVGDYVEMPILLKYSILTGGVRPYVHAGASVGYLLDADVDVSAGGGSIAVGIDELIEPADYGLVFGGGIALEFEAFGLFFDGRYALGLADVWKGGEVHGETLPDAEAKTRGIQVLAGVTRSFGE